MRDRIIESKIELESILGEHAELAKLFSDKFGLINAVLERNNFRKYNLYMYQCLSSSTKVLFDLQSDITSGGLGFSSSPQDALIGCFAEAIERYCMTICRDSDMILGYYKDLPTEMRLNDFGLYTIEQYRQNPSFANPETDNIHWSVITSVHNCSKKYWPSSLIYLPFEVSKPVCQSTSTGMAAGFSVLDCVKNGLMEVVERDAIMLNFMQHLNPPEIRLETLNHESLKLVNSLLKKYKIRIYKLYTDTGVPIFLSLIWKGRGQQTHFGIGAAAHFNSDIAIFKAINESMFTFYYSQNIMDLRKTEPKEINTLYEHILYYQGKNFYDLLFDSDKISYEKQIIEYDDVLHNILESGSAVYYKEITSSDVSCTNIKVVKVVVPGFIDLNKSHTMPRLAAERYWSVPRKLGLPYNKNLSEKPHPFP